MEYSAGQIADILSAEIHGNRDLSIRVLVSSADACDGAIYPLFKSRYLEELHSGASAVLIPPELLSRVRDQGPAAILVHPVPLMALTRLIALFYPEETPAEPAVHSSAVIHPTATLHPTVVVEPLAVIERDVVIGEGSYIGAGAVICRNTRIGRWTRIGPRAVIGWEGFGFIPSQGVPERIRQVGLVEIGDFVDIGAATCVDRGTLGKTRIENGAKLDNLVQVGHNVQIGENAIIAAQVGLAGSTRVGRGVLIGGQSGVADHLQLGSGARIAAKSGVTRDVPKDAVVAGYPAMDRWRWLRMIARAGGS